MSVANRANSTASATANLLMRAKNDSRLSALLQSALRLKPEHYQLRQLSIAANPPPGVVELMTPSAWLGAFAAVRKRMPSVCSVEDPPGNLVAMGIVIDPDLVLTSADAARILKTDAAIRFAPEQSNRETGNTIPTVFATVSRESRRSLDTNAVIVALRFAMPGGSFPLPAPAAVPLANRYAQGDVLLIVDEPFVEFPRISIGSVSSILGQTSDMVERLSLRVYRDHIFPGAPCFTPDGLLSAIIIHQSGDTAIAVPSPAISVLRGNERAARRSSAAASQPVKPAKREEPPPATRPSSKKIASRGQWKKKARSRSSIKKKK